MSQKFSGRQFNVGVAKESTRGTALAAQYWLPYNTLSVDDEVKFALNEQVYGVIEKGVGQDLAMLESKATLDGMISDQGFGLLLKSLFGTEVVTTVETTAKDHKFTVLESAQHPTVTLSVVEPNSNAGAGFAYPLCAVDEIQMDFEINKYCTYKATLMGNKGVTLANTTAYTLENLFRPQDGTFKIATNLAGLGAAAAVNITKANITMKQNTEPDQVIGNVNPVDRLNKEFDVTGTIELKYSDRTMIDTYLVANLPMAMSFAFANTGVTIGAISNPTFTVRLAKVYITGVSRKIDPKGIVTQSIKFDADYSISDTEMIDITMRNTVSAAY